MSGMSEDEKSQMQWQQTNEELARLRQENALLSLGAEYPEELPEFRKILDASTPKEQLDLIRALRKQVAAAPSPQAPPAEGEPAIPQVDLNNPPASQNFDPKAPTYNGQPMTEDWADRILRSVQRMR